MSLIITEKSEIFAGDVINLISNNANGKSIHAENCDCRICREKALFKREKIIRAKIRKEQEELVDEQRRIYKRSVESDKKLIKNSKSFNIKLKERELVTFMDKFAVYITGFGVLCCTISGLIRVIFKPSFELIPIALFAITLYYINNKLDREKNV